MDRECHLYTKQTEQYTEEAVEYAARILGVLNPIIDEMFDKGIPGYEISHFVSRQVEYHFIGKLMFKEVEEEKDNGELL